MRSASFIILNALACIVFALALPAKAATTIAILTPERSRTDQIFVEKLAVELGKKLSLTDQDLAASAYRSVDPASPFNMSADEAKRVGNVIGCDFFLLMRTAIQRRNSSDKGDHFEAYAVVYLVSSRTGHLADWKLRTFEDAVAERAEQKLMQDATGLGRAIAKRVIEVAVQEVAVSPLAAMEEPPDPGSPLSKNFKAPVPFRRIKPEYTDLAALYEVAGTVDVIIDLDAKGAVLRTEIVRWLGYGLEGSVEKAVREMNWRPAERDSKFLPMRFLVRYNFKKIEKTN